MMISRLVALALAASPVFAQVDVLTPRVDNSRSGVYGHETVLTPQTVRTRFGKLWTLYADAKIMAQPLYVSNLAVPLASIVGSTAKTKCASGCNAVVFATLKGAVYAYMAESLRWARWGMPNRFSAMAVPCLRRPGRPTTTWLSTE
jgi:hypothetical protein